MSQNYAVREKIIAFLKYHDEHARFYEMAYEKANELKTEAKTLKALAVRWVETQAICAGNSNSETITCKTGCNTAFVKNDGSPFIKSDELTELTHLKARLKALAGCFGDMNQWLIDVKKSSENTFALPINDPTFNLLYIQQFVILNNEEESLHDLLFIAEVLRKACDLLDSINFSSRVIRDDFLGQKFIPRLLLVASAVVEGSANFGRLAVELIRSNEDHWKEFNEAAPNIRTK